jgi:hypothetical protein
MVKHCTHLLDGDARKPLHELTNLDSILEVLKKS